jgi:hypothetical protein
MSYGTIKSGASLQQFLGDVIKESLLKKKLVIEDSDKAALKTGDVTVKDIVEKLNVIRSGRSLKDEDVKSSMEKYINDLESAEKTALFSFLKGISEIVTAGVEGEKAFEPSEKPASVKMEKKPTSSTIKVKPVVVKKPPAEKKSAEKEEDTTPPIKASK